MKAKTRYILLLLFLIIGICYIFWPDSGPVRLRWISSTTARDGFLVQLVYDDRRQGSLGGRSIRFLAIASQKYHLLCNIQQKNADGSSSVDLEARWYEMNENHGERFGTWLVSCEVPEGIADVEKVLLMEKGGDWSKEFTVHTVIPPAASIKNVNWNYSICMPLIYGDKYSGEALAEFVEFYRLCGFEHISLYVSSDSLQDSTRRAIRYYEKEGLMDATEYRVPVRGLWNHGQLGMIHDCLVRHSIASRWVSFQDLDEFLVSKEKGVSLVQQLDAFPEDVVSIRIPAQYMTRDNSSSPLTFFNLRTIDGVDRHATKCIVRPIHIFEQGIHHTSRLLQENSRVMAADDDKLRLFHYRHNLISEKTDSTIPDSFPSLPALVRSAMLRIHKQVV